MSIRFHIRLFLALLVACLASTAMISTAEARHKHYKIRYSPKIAYSSKIPYSPPSASFVMDAHTGDILYSRNADTKCHPASLTKVMTLYLLFEQLHEGKATLNTLLPISRHAANQAPSRLGVKPGETIKVNDAILALVTRSANDVAVVIAEYLGGTETNFAQRMTDKARALGMTQTQYLNASGLPNNEQVTSARDQALLAKHIQTDFPQYFPYFSTAKFAWQGTYILNHNHLLGKYDGVTGLKTGYTAASGFNLTTTVTRDNKSLIGVVLGGKSAQARDKEMVAILDRSLPLAEGCCYNDNLSRSNSGV